MLNLLNAFNELTKMISRNLYDQICNYLDSNKVLLIFGARRVGKSVLIQQILKEYDKEAILLNGEDLDDADRITAIRKSMYDTWIKGIDLLIIDEAHAIDSIGAALKLIIDSYPQLTIIATGSSAFDLNRSSGEPLVGRRIVFDMFPLSESEIVNEWNPVEAQRMMPSRILYGSYPEVITMDDIDKKTAYLKDLVSTYLLKDILAYENIKHSGKLVALLKLIAFQVGSEVSYDELSNALRIDRNTVERYLDLMSKVFVLFRLGGYSGNLRKEVTKSSKWYFYDTGLRNAIIGDFRPLAARQDKGQLWENFFIAERMKYNRYALKDKEYYFWRTYDQQELDFLEVEVGKLEAFEAKYTQKKAKVPIAFRKAYPDAKMHIVSSNNYQGFVT